MPDPILISPGFLEVLSLPGWNRLTDPERLIVADYLMERFEAHRWSIDFLGLRRFGPPGAEQAVLQWHDSQSELTFSLIPGGAFHPGYSPALLPEYDRVYRLLQARDFEPQEEDPDMDEEDRLEPLTETPVNDVRAREM